MYHPTLDEVQKLADQGNLVPIYRDTNADLETPVSAYMKVARGPYTFLLESVEGGNRIARYSFIGIEPYDVIRTGPGQSHGDVDPLVLLQKAMADVRIVGEPSGERFHGGAVGFLAYEVVGHFERLPTPGQDPLGLPESVFMLTDTFLIFDHLLHTIRVVSHARLDGDVERAYANAVERIDEIVSRLDAPLPIHRDLRRNEATISPETNMSRSWFEEMVGTVKDYIVAGDVIQVVVSQRFQRPITVHPFEIYRALRAINPSPYMYYLQLDDFQIVGASPELLVQVIDGKVSTHPIAGTRPRGTTLEEDRELEEGLRGDAKERAEHIMLVDLGRNDVGRVSKPGTVEVTQYMDIERYSHVMHLVSHVTGELRDDYTSFDVMRACFPAGTVSGAPKIRAMEIIADLESDKRGPYAGAVGYFDFVGNMDTAITIRTLVVKDGMAYTQAGGGIVFDSKPSSEYEESEHKASAVLRAIECAEMGG